jgi:hypothetical protein
MTRAPHAAQINLRFGNGAREFFLFGAGTGPAILRGANTCMHTSNRLFTTLEPATPGDSSGLSA